MENKTLQKVDTMLDNEKLIITATTANSWIYPDVKNWAENTDTLVEDAISCAEAGASILHVHLPRGQEKEVVDRIRDKTDAIIQAGMSSYHVNKRTPDFKAKPDLISCILNHHAELFPSGIFDVLHPIEEFEVYGKKCNEYGVKAEWEVWNCGSWWMLKYIEEKGWFTGQHITTMFFGWPGSSWSPPTIDAYLYRLRYKPENCKYSVSVMGEEQPRLLSTVIANGGHIRVGTEDNPFITPSVPAKNNAEIIKKWVNFSKEMGREVADPSEARKILKL